MQRYSNLLENWWRLLVIYTNWGKTCTILTIIEAYLKVDFDKSVQIEGVSQDYEIRSKL